MNDLCDLSSHIGRLWGIWAHSTNIMRPVQREAGIEQHVLARRRPVLETPHIFSEMRNKGLISRASRE